jgi:putative lipoic acid-binding regulatory protein
MQPERIEFPADYPIKVVARVQPGLRQQIDAIFERHFGPAPTAGVGERPSAQGRFIALTYVPRVSGVEQLEALHVELTAVEGVMMVI